MLNVLLVDAIVVVAGWIGSLLVACLHRIKWKQKPFIILNIIDGILFFTTFEFFAACVLSNNDARVCV